MSPLDVVRLPLAVGAAAAILLAGCEFSGAVQEPRATGAGSSSAASASDDGVGPSNSTPPVVEAADQVFGPFRRGAVPVPPGLLAAATERCQATPTPRITAEVGSRPVVVADLRGDGRLLLVFADAEAAVGCRVTVADDGTMRATFFRVDPPMTGVLARDDLTLAATEYVDDATGQFVVAAGQVGEGAVHVRAGFDDDTYTTASIEDGWWVMWWPGAVRPANITADDNKNVVIASVDPR